MHDAEDTQTQQYKVSVIVPTLGGDCLRGTIEQLNCGTIVPTEILVCIPEEEAFRVAHLSFPNVRILKTSCRGQVAQRAIGFQQAQQPLVLQLDDDVMLQENSLQVLANTLYSLGHGNALAPVYYDTATGRCIHELFGGGQGFLRNLYYSVVCGSSWGVKRMGTVTAAGLSFGVDGAHCGEKPFDVQWLPGGCVLCFREDLITENFFPYPGKAYCEDLIHSFLRIKHGVQHRVLAKAKCLIDMPEPELARPSILAQRKAPRYFVRLSEGDLWRLALYDFLSILKRAFS